MFRHVLSSLLDPVTEWCMYTSLTGYTGRLYALFAALASQEKRLIKFFNLLTYLVYHTIVLIHVLVCQQIVYVFQQRRKRQ